MVCPLILVPGVMLCRDTLPYPLEIASRLGHESVQTAIEELRHNFEELEMPPVSMRWMTHESLPGVMTTLIPRTTKHPGAGSFIIDEALSMEHIEWLLSLHERVPVETTSKKKKEGLCSERSYFCDASGYVRSALQAAIWNAQEVVSPEVGLVIQVFAHMRFLDYSVVGTTLNPHVDICRVDPISGRRSTHTFILYLTDCPQGGETSLLGDVSGEKQSQILACISPKRGRLLLFPHACPHEGNAVRDVPKILLRGEVFLSH